MGVNRLQYGRKLEKELGAGKGVAKAHKTATKKFKTPSKKKYDEGALIKKVTRMLKMIYHGKKYHKKKK